MNMIRAEDPLSLIHPVWIKKHGLDKLHGEVKKVPAAILMHPCRFDLFAKYYYIRCRKTSPLKAKRVYLESLRCLVPFGKEYGKEEEKSSFAKHFEVFDGLIDTFASEEFDPSFSLVPVGADNVILDGAHRVATLSFYKKNIWVCEFSYAIGDCFDYDYFISHWMSEYVADLTAFEGMCFLKGMAVLCVWRNNYEIIPEMGRVFYQRSFTVNQKEYSKLRSIIEPDWKETWNEDGRHVDVRFVFLHSPFGLEVIEPDSMTIITGDEAVRRVSSIVLTRKGRKAWRSWSVVAAVISEFFSSFRSILVMDVSYWKFRLKKRLSVFDNKIWISFYGIVSRLWK